MLNESVTEEMTIKEIKEEKNGTYHVQTALSLLEGTQQTHLLIENKIEIEKTARNLENNWGLQAILMQSSVAAPPLVSNLLNLQVGKYTVLSFPCPVRNLSEVDPQLLQFKLVTTKSSDLTVTSLKNWEGSRSLTVECAKRIFTLQLRTSFPVVRYKSIQETEGQPVVLNVKKNDSGRNLIKQSLERELGFEIEADK